MPRQLQKETTLPRRKLWENTEKEIPWSLRLEHNNMQTIENSPDELGRTKVPVIPGTRTYSETVRCSSAPPRSTNSGSQDFTVEEKQQRIRNIRKGREARESKTLIFSSSITRDIKKQSFNSDCKKSDVVFHEFRGKKI